MARGQGPRYKVQRREGGAPRPAPRGREATGHGRRSNVECRSTTITGYRHCARLEVLIQVSRAEGRGPQAAGRRESLRRSRAAGRRSQARRSDARCASAPTLPRAPGHRSPKSEARSIRHTGIRGTGRGLADSKFQIPNSKLQSLEFGVWSLESAIRQAWSLELGACYVVHSSRTTAPRSLRAAYGVRRFGYGVRREAVLPYFRISVARTLRQPVSPTSGRLCERREAEAINRSR